MAERVCATAVSTKLGSGVAVAPEILQASETSITTAANARTGAGLFMVLLWSALIIRLFINNTKRSGFFGEAKMNMLQRKLGFHLKCR
jgi:hypothetical protein